MTLTTLDPRIFPMIDHTGATASDAGYVALMKLAQSARAPAIKIPLGASIQLADMTNFVPPGIGFIVDGRAGTETDLGAEFLLPNDAGGIVVALSAANSPGTTCQMNGVKGTFAAASSGSPQRVIVNNVWYTYTGTTGANDSITLTGLSLVLGTGGFLGCPLNTRVYQGYGFVTADNSYPTTVFGEGIGIVGPSAGGHAGGNWITETILGDSGVTLPSSTVTLAAATNWPTSGTALIYDQLVAYTGKSGNNLTGCTGGTGTYGAGTAAICITIPQASDGVLVGHGCIFDCYVAGFRHATAYNGDHNHWGPHFAPQGNFSAICAESLGGSQGDQTFADGLVLATSVFCSIYVTAGNALSNIKAGKLHMGYGPFGIYKEALAGISSGPHADNPGISTTCQWDTLGIEDWDFAGICSADGQSSIYGDFYINSGANYSGYGGGVATFLCQVQNAVFIGPNMWSLSPSFPLVLGGFAQMTIIASDQYPAPLIWAPSLIQFILGTAIGTYYEAGTTITGTMAVEFASPNATYAGVVVPATGGGIPAGIALQSASAGQQLAVATEGSPKVSYTTLPDQGVIVAVDSTNPGNLIAQITGATPWGICLRGNNELQLRMGYTATQIGAPSALATYLINHTAGYLGINGGTSSAISTTGATLLVVAVSWYGYSTSQLTVSDSSNNSYTLGPSIASGGNGIAIYTCIDPVVSSSQTYTIAGTGIYAAVAVAAFSGGYTGASADLSASGAGAFPFQPGGGSPLYNGELILSAVRPGTAGTISVNESFTITDQVSGVVALAYLLQTQGVTVNPTWSNTGNGSGAAALLSFP
jgi:hypothetical protein